MKFFTRIAAIAGAMAMLVAVVASANAATTADATVAITTQPGAGLTASIQAASLGSYPYSFSQQTATGTLTLGATDTRGTAAGWHVSLNAQSANFVGTTASNTIPVSGLKINAAGTISTISGNAVVTGQTTPGITSVSTGAANIWAAALGSGDGNYTLVSGVSLVIPAGKLVDSYTVTLEVGINTGP